MYCAPTKSLARSLSVVAFPKKPVGWYETFPHIDSLYRNLSLLSKIAFDRPIVSTWPIGKLNSSVEIDFSPSYGMRETLVLLGAAAACKKRARYIDHEKGLDIFRSIKAKISNGWTLEWDLEDVLNMGFVVLLQYLGHIL
jgi:hypothetical protein